MKPSSGPATQVSNIQSHKYHCVLSHVQLFMTPWAVAHQAPLSMGFSRQEYWSGLPCPFPRGLPNLGIEPKTPGLAGRFFTTEPPGKPIVPQLGKRAPKNIYQYINRFIPWKEVIGDFSFSFMLSALHKFSRMNTYLFCNQKYVIDVSSIDYTGAVEI